MGRYYRLSKALSEAEASEIMREVREIEEVDEAEYSEGYTKILVFTNKEKISGGHDEDCQYCQSCGAGMRIKLCRVCGLKQNKDTVFISSSPVLVCFLACQPALQWEQSQQSSDQPAIESRRRGAPQNPNKGCKREETVRRRIQVLKKPEFSGRQTHTFTVSTPQLLS